MRHGLLRAMLHAMPQPFDFDRFSWDNAAMSKKCLAAALLFLIGCSEPPPAYDPASFRGAVQALIDAKKYGVAVAYLRSADAGRQAVFDEAGYLAVGEDAIVLPGVNAQIRYDRTRDWLMPGTSDAIKNVEWQRAATEFAAAYNRARRGS
jgi:hypothetical protein